MVSVNCIIIIHKIPTPSLLISITDIGTTLSSLRGNRTQGEMCWGGQREKVMKPWSSNSNPQGSSADTQTETNRFIDSCLSTSTPPK